VPNEGGIVTRSIEKFVHGVLWVAEVFAVQILLLIVEVLLSAADVKRSIIAHPVLAAVALTIIVVVLGASISYWKLRRLKSYAATEIIVGAVLGFNSAYRMPANNFRFSEILGLLSAVYVVARGFNNLASAERQPQKAESNGQA